MPLVPFLGVPSVDFLSKVSLLLFFIRIFFFLIYFRRSFTHLSKVFTCDSYFMLEFIGCYCSYMPFWLWMLLYGIWWSFYASFNKAWFDTSFPIHVLITFWNVQWLVYGPRHVYQISMYLFSSIFFFFLTFVGWICLQCTWDNWSRFEVKKPSQPKQA